MNKLTDQQIQTMTNMLRAEGRRFLKQEFDMELEIPLRVNGRLKRALGRFVAQRNARTGERIPLRIELSKIVLQNGYELALDTLKHELIHYALMVQGLPHKDHDNEFIEACTSRSVSLTDTVKVKQERVIMECDKCGHEWSFLRRRNNHIHTGCGGDLVYKGKRIE